MTRTLTGTRSPGCQRKRRSSTGQEAGRILYRDLPGLLFKSHGLQSWNGKGREARIAKATGMIVKNLAGLVVPEHNLSANSMSKPDRIRGIIKSSLGKITKAEILEHCPDISKITVQRTLAELQRRGEVVKLSGRRYTAYTWNRERE